MIAVCHLACLVLPCAWIVLWGVPVLARLLTISSSWCVVLHIGCPDGQARVLSCMEQAPVVCCVGL